MVNKVVLCGVLVSDLKKGDGGKVVSVFSRIRVARYGVYFVNLPFKMWGTSAEFALKKELKAGDGVQCIGTLGTNKDDGAIMLTVDSIGKIPWLTKAHNGEPWETAGKNQAS